MRLGAALALLGLLGLGVSSPTPSPVPQKPVVGLGGIFVVNDGGNTPRGSWGVGFDAGGPIITSTWADLHLQVVFDGGGSDSNPCTTDAGACATIQGAWSKVPKYVRHLVEISAACTNNATGANLVGVEQVNDVQASTGGVWVHGTWLNSVLASGPATGTATGGTKFSNGTWLVEDGEDGGPVVVNATLTLADAGWTPNDLQGRYLLISSGTGSSATTWRPITDNTSDTITVEGFLVTAPSSNSVFSIQEPCTKIATAVPRLPTAATTTPPVVSGTLGSAFNISGHFVGNSGLLIQGFEVTATAGAIVINNGSGVTLTNITNKVATKSSGSSANKVIVNGVGADAVTSITNSYFAFQENVSSSANFDTSPIHINHGGLGRVSLTAVVMMYGGNGLQVTSGSGTVSNSESRRVYHGIAEFLGPGPNTVTNSIAGGYLGWCIQAGESHDGAGVQHTTTFDHVHFQSCSPAIQQGGGSLYVKTYSIRRLDYSDGPPVLPADAGGGLDLTAAKVIKCLAGGHATFNASVTPGTPQFVPSNGGTWDIYAGSDGFTVGNFVDITLSDDNGGDCVHALTDSSSVCKNFRN